MHFEIGSNAIVAQSRLKACAPASGPNQQRINMRANAQHTSAHVKSPAQAQRLSHTMFQRNYKLELEFVKCKLDNTTILQKSAHAFTHFTTCTNTFLHNFDPNISLRALALEMRDKIRPGMEARAPETVMRKAAATERNKNAVRTNIANRKYFTPRNSSTKKNYE